MAEHRKKQKKMMLGLSIFLGGFVLLALFPRPYSLPLGGLCMCGAFFLLFGAFGNSDHPGDGKSKPVPTNSPSKEEPSKVSDSSAEKKDTPMVHQDPLMEEYCQKRNYYWVQEEPPKILDICRTLQISRQAPKESWQMNGLIEGKETLPFYLFEYTAPPSEKNKTPFQYRVCSFQVSTALPSLTLWEQGKGAPSLSVPPGVRKIYFQSDRFNNAFVVYGNKIFAYELISPGMMEFLIGYSKESTLPVSIETSSGLVCFYYRPSGQAHTPDQLDRLVDLGREFCRNIPPIIADKYGVK